MIFTSLEEKKMKKYYLISSLIVLILSSCSSKTQTNTQAKEGVTTSAKTTANVKQKTATAFDSLSTKAEFGLDEQDRKIMEKTSPRTVERMDRNEPLTINDIIKLSQGGVSDDTIIKYINETKTTYNLTQSQINRLQEAGVSQRVINYMVDTGK